jgi:hypothetical protein
VDRPLAAQGNDEPLAFGEGSDGNVGPNTAAFQDGPLSLGRFEILCPCNGTALAVVVETDSERRCFREADVVGESRMRLDIAQDARLTSDIRAG